MPDRRERCSKHKDVLYHWKPSNEGDVPGNGCHKCAIEHLQERVEGLERTVSLFGDQAFVKIGPIASPWLKKFLEAIHVGWCRWSPQEKREGVSLGQTHFQSDGYIIPLDMAKGLVAACDEIEKVEKKAFERGIEKGLLQVYNAIEYIHAQARNMHLEKATKEALEASDYGAGQITFRSVLDKAMREVERSES